MSQAARYYVPEPSRWPIFGSIALLLMAFGAASWLNHIECHITAPRKFALNCRIGSATSRR